jgi:hypothetical protein
MNSMIYHGMTNLYAQGRKVALTASAEDRSLRIQDYAKRFRTAVPHATPARAVLPTMSEESLDLLQQAVRNILAVFADARC